MPRRLRKAFAAFILASGPIFAAFPTLAQDPGDPPADVARVAIVSGAVSSHQPGSQDWQAAQQNYPLAPGSGVWTEPRAHAAVDVAGARVHLDASSQLEVTAIDPGQVQLAVPQGAAVIRVYPGVSGVNFQVNTAHGTANISQPGQYEIVAGDDQHPASLSVIEGQAQFVGQNANLALQSGQRGTITPNSQSSVDAAQPDDFVRFVQQQEQPYQQQVAQTAQYVSPQQAGYQDLARYGQWSQAPQYGAVWYPQSVPANWAPYRDGHWAYVAPWGWTWVDDAPWGFTPFHYGRWVQVGHRWAWVPGARAARPIYAPALVSFFDLGGVGVDLSLGWVPLAPEEVYVPTYRHSPRYVHDVNITNVRNETTIINVVNKKTVINVDNYRNYRGATSASRDAMEQGRAVGDRGSQNDKAKRDQQWANAKPDPEVAFRPQPQPKPQHQPERQNMQPNVQAQKTWNNNGAPKPPNSPALQKDVTSKHEAAKPQIPAAPKPGKSQHNPQSPAVYPAAAPKPAVQPQKHDQTPNKAQWEAQRQQSAPQQHQQPAKQQWKQPEGPPKDNRGQPQQKKPAQNCGQQPGVACQ